MDKSLPSFNKWLKMIDAQRLSAQTEWNPYADEGKALVQKILNCFIEKYGKIKNLIIEKFPGVAQGGSWVITVEYPFLFDRRQIPKTFLGIDVKHSTSLDDLPEEFRVKNENEEYVWAPERFEAFVDRCREEIRKKLGDPDMSREDMLDALCFGDFKAHVAHCRKAEKEGIIPRFRSKG